MSNTTAIEGEIKTLINRLRGLKLIEDRGEGGFGVCLIAMLSCLNEKDIYQIYECLPYHKRYDEFIIINSLSDSGHKPRALSSSLNNLDERFIPCIFSPDNSTYQSASPFVIIEKNGDHLTVFDSKSESILNIDKNNDYFGKVIFFNENDNEVENKKHQDWFSNLIYKFKKTFISIFIISFFISILSLATPIFVMLTFDKVISENNLSFLYPIILIAIVALAFEFLIKKIRSESLSWVGSKIDFIVGSKIFEKLVLMPASFTEKAAISSQASKIKSFQYVREFFTSNLFFSLIDIPFSIILLLFISFISFEIALIPILAISFYSLVFLLFNKKSIYLIKDSGHAFSEKQELIFESFSKMHGSRINGLTSVWFDKFRQFSGVSSVKSFKASFIPSIIETISHGTFMLCGVMVIIIGVHNTWEGKMTSGEMIASMIIVWKILTPFQILCNSLPSFYRLFYSIDQLNKLIKIKTEDQDGQSKSNVSEIHGEVQIAKAGLRYNKHMDPVFTGLSLKALRGDLITITGNSGTGKSTILKLINGMYHPQVGRIQVDGKNIEQLDCFSLRKNIAYVPQKPNFFSGTIAENLRFSDPLASDGAIRAALEKVDAWQDVCCFPEGVYTKIGHRGIGLSDNLAFRLSLARAYLKDANIILLDEMPYSLINSDFGDKFYRQLLRWKGERTIFLVTYRDEYIKLSDKVVLLRNSIPPLVDSYEKINKFIEKSRS